MQVHIPFVAASVLALAVTTSSTPVVTHVAPATPAVSARAQVLSIHGKEFMAGLTLAVTTPEGQTDTFTGSAIQARTETSFQVSLMFATPGRYQFVVTNTDGGTSEPFALEVAARKTSPAAPVIERVTPSEPTAHPEPQLLRVDGQRFESGLRAIVTDETGAELPEVSVTKVTPRSFELRVRLDKAARYELVVNNPSGAVSNVVTITVR